MTSVRKVLVTGGAGYIGSHTCKQLHRAGYLPVSYDSLLSGHRHAVRWGPLIVGDLADRTRLKQVMKEHAPLAVVHFAALAYVGESVRDPAAYYRANVEGTLSLLAAMRDAGIDTLVFSSSCATYGIPERLPITEAMPQMPVSPYGRSKLMGEQILEDYARAYGLRFVALRYFNACGADLEGEIGEEHSPETHLIPRALMAAAGDIPHLEIFGDNHDTPDGTCVRDFVHVEDLARVHILAAAHLDAGGENLKLNVGTGTGHSVRDVLTAVEAITGVRPPVVVGRRRDGDPAALYADVSMAKRALGFGPGHLELESAIRSAWAFEQRRRDRILAAGSELS